MLLKLAEDVYLTHTDTYELAQKAAMLTAAVLSALSLPGRLAGGIGSSSLPSRAGYQRRPQLQADC